MKINRKNTVLSDCQQKYFDELYIVDTLIKMLQRTCEDREFKGQYYGTSTEIINSISAERNEYLSLLELILDKISLLKNLNLKMENIITLQENANYSSR